MQSKVETSWRRLFVVTLIGVAFCVTDRQALAQEPEKVTPEVQQLKEKLQKLEQTVQELKTQLADIDKPKLVPAADVKPAQPAASTAADSTTASTNKKQDTKKGESTLSVYGFAMLDVGYQFNQNHPDWFDTVRPTKLPAFKDQFAPDGKTYFGVRQSRLGVKSTTPTEFGELKTVFEFELFGTGIDAGQTTFRLRHAYGELGNFGAGQYWTVFGDTDAFPNILEYWGPNGLVWFRNVQVRWMPIKGNNSLTLALERPGASGDQGLFVDRIELQGIRPKLDLPDLTGNVRFNRGWGHVQLAGVVRRIRWVDTINDEFDLNGTEWGWGVSVSSAPKFGKNDVGRLAFVYGEGIENYMNDAPVDIGIGLNTATNINLNPARPIKGVALPVLGVSAFLDHTWSKQFSSAIGYSLVNIENANRQSADAYHRGQYALTNLLYYPYENVMVGGEFQWGRRENFLDGFASNDYRIQFSFRYNFSKVFGL
ncbi:MAG TPA: DcaP family trimeric outer membrane transporter [Blastocatellia bacterium]|nr:DcaP family trimeric outer membrane transporter [Blastocatellia bacterium]